MKNIGIINPNSLYKFILIFSAFASPTILAVLSLEAITCLTPLLGACTLIPPIGIDC